MGSYIDFSGRITIVNKKTNMPFLNQYTVDELNSETAKKIIKNIKLHTIQIDDNLPDKVFHFLNNIFERRPDIYFRIFGGFGQERKLDFLRNLSNVKKLIIENHGAIDLSILTEMKQLESLYVSVFDLRDYSFLQDLNSGLKDLSLFMDVKSGSNNFDCKWLLHFENMESLYLGKAKKNITAISEMKHLKQLTLRGIKLLDYSFLARCSLQVLKIHWCSAEGMDTLAALSDLQEIELWRIIKLSSLSFLSSLKNLRIIRLQDLARVEYIPYLTELSKLEEIHVDNVKSLIDISTLCTSNSLKQVKINYGPLYGS